MSHFWSSGLSFDAVTFDLANVLVPTKGLGEAAFAHVVRRTGLDPLTHLARFSEVWSRRDSRTPLAQVFVEIGSDGLHAQFVEEFERRAVTAPEVPGASSLLRHLADAKLRLALVSYAPQAALDRQLKVRGWKSYFSAVIAREQFTQPKPNPTCFRHASAELGASLERSLAIEHSGVGVHAARSAGLTVVHIGCRNEAQCTEPADYHAYALADVESDILGMSPV